MADPEWEGLPERPLLRRAIRHRLRNFAPSIKVVAEGFLAEASTIDLLAVGDEGEMISVRIGREGDDRALLTQSLADLAWLRPRLADFLKIAPGLGLEPSAEPRALLVCPQFSSETRAAVEIFPSGAIELLRYRCLAQRGHLSVLLDSALPLHGPSAPESEQTESRPAPSIDPPGQPTTPPPHPTRPSRLADPPSSSTFRTGLTDADLRPEASSGADAVLN